ncbi:MAG: HAMP domain-containing histidine kinase [Rhodobacteraceae bacterium]|nr:MAG: HAMP domain-containing histidine kinase [Paracoccaceae bacterium]
MDRANVFSGSAFRTAVFAAVAVAATLFVAALAAFAFVQQTLEREIQRQILAEQVMLREIYDKGGEAALIRTIAEIDTPVALSRRALGAFGADGLKLAGNIARAPRDVRFQRTELALSGQDIGRLRFYVHTARFDQVVLVIGHDLSLVAATERRLVVALGAAGLLAGTTILLIGYMASRRSLRKLNALDAALARVSEGDTEARVPTPGGTDQIDRISARVNAHLDRLSSLMITTKSTAAAVAHDLKTPLSRAQLSLQSARDLTRQGRDVEAAIEEAEADLARLNAIFDTILRISRIESGARDIAFEHFDLMPLLTELVETFAPLAEERGQTLTLVAPATPVAPVLGDARMIRQMIANLIQNAITHGPAGNAIEIVLDSRQGAARVVIADRGPGIPENARSRVFDPFYRLDRSRSGGGSGLGLALVQAIALRHGVALDLSDNDPGLRVSLTFPPVAPPKAGAGRGNLSKS